MELEHIFAGEDWLDWFGATGGGLRNDSHLFVLRQIINDHIEHEAIQLRFGQGIRAFHLDGVLRGQDKKGFLERVSHTSRGDLMLLHGFEQSGLGFGRSAIDFVSQNHVGKQRTLDEKHLSALGCFSENFSADNIRRHQIGCDLDALEFQMENLGDGFYQQRLGESGSAGDEAMSTGEQAE